MIEASIDEIFTFVRSHRPSRDTFWEVVVVPPRDDGAEGEGDHKSWFHVVASADRYEDDSGQCYFYI